MTDRPKVSNERDEAQFEARFRDACARPAMYVGRCSLRAVSDYLSGYDHALRDSGQILSPLTGWSRWIEMRFLISHPAWHWTRIVLHEYGSDEAAFVALPGLRLEFLADREALGVEGIERELRRRLIEQSG